MFAPGIELRDVASEALVEAPSGSPLWLAITGGAAFLPEGRSFSAMVMLGVPLDRIGRGRRSFTAPIAGGPAGAQTEEETPALKPAPQSKKPRSGEEAPAPPPEAKGPPQAPAPKNTEPAAAIEPPVMVTPDLARTVVRAALKRAKLEDPWSRVDALASRSRAASLLPELRFRVSRLVDEDQQLSPTEYDPTRITASGGTSLWLEARATWRLDRIVFGDDEMALERMRHDRAEAQAKLIEKVLDLLFAWQRAEAQAASPLKTPEDRLLARLKAIEAKTSLDLLTGGAALGTGR